MGLRLVTWNVNSIRVRLEHLARLVRETQPDLVCLQETKASDEDFPSERARALGFPHLWLAGEKGYNGVAVLSRRPIVDGWRLAWCGRSDQRHAAVRLADGLEVHVFYVPKGGQDPDPVANEKFAHKLAFLEEMRAWAVDERRRARPLALLGDLNVAPLESDVWNHQRIKRYVGHTPLECERLLAVQEAGGFVDAERRFVPPDRPLYTWWGYRYPHAFAKDYGWRLDHVWLTPPLAERLRAVQVRREVRGWPRPSDHAPVVVDLG